MAKYRTKIDGACTYCAVRTMTVNMPLEWR